MLCVITKEKIHTVVTVHFELTVSIASIIVLSS